MARNLGTASTFRPARCRSRAKRWRALMLYYSREPAAARGADHLALPDREALMEALGKSLAACRNCACRSADAGSSGRTRAGEAHNALRIAPRPGGTSRPRAPDSRARIKTARAPERVECFDVSHTAARGDPVASCVVFGPTERTARLPALQHKKESPPATTTGAMHQALRRHGARYRGGERARPDLLLIDAVRTGRCRRVGGCRGGGRWLPVVECPRARTGARAQERLHCRATRTPVILEADSAARILSSACAMSPPLCDHRPSPAARAALPRIDSGTVPGLGHCARRAILTHSAGCRASCGPASWIWKSRRRRRGDGTFDL